MSPLDTATRASLVGHGVVVFFLGLLAGFPYGLAVGAGAEEPTRAWRMAHLEGVLNGLLLMAVGAAGGLLTLTLREAAWLRGSLLAAGYGNVVASGIGAATGVRGLAPSGPAANLVVFTLFMIAVAGAFLALLLAARGAFRRAA